MKIRIHITKEILQKSKHCGGPAAQQSQEEVGSNCAVALAVRDIFPNAYVSSSGILLNGIKQNESYPGQVIRAKENKSYVYLSEEVIAFIQAFDAHVNYPHKREELAEASFEIEVHDRIIDKIGIQEAKNIIQASKTLDLVEEILV